MAEPALWDERILFIDGEAIVLDKPAGLAVHPGPATRRSLEDHLPDLRFGFQRAPSPVHRLDRDTSGCLLLARNPKALKRFAAEFEAGRVAKTYLAVLEGVPEGEEGAIDLPLAKVSSRAEGWRMVPSPKGKAALTRWRLVGEAQGRALIRFEPATGRTHQLRVHAAEGLGIPILGDPIYGRGGRQGTMLHAAALRLERGAKPPVEARAPLPATFSVLGFADDGF
jgi:tRNA pseudouridine32 synthase/23S rRNA pseudouridine746 synthase